MTGANAIRGILFDKDGTLVEMDPMWLPAWADAADRIADAAGRPGIADEMLRRVGYDRATGRIEADATLLAGSGRDIIDAWGTVLGQDAPPGLDDVLWQVFAEASTRDPRPTADLGALFGRLRKEGYILGIATNDSTRKVDAMVRHLGIADDLAFFCGADAGHGGKPGPGMALAFCERTGIDPRNAAMVGDSIMDALMARAAGYGLVVGVRTGSAMTRQTERSFDVVIDSVEDLPGLMGDPQACGPGPTRRSPPSMTRA